MTSRARMAESDRILGSATLSRLRAIVAPRGGRLSLRANFSWTFAGRVVYSACQWGLLVVLARLTSTEMVGRYSLGLALAAPVFAFSNLDLRQVQATDARQEYDFGHYLSLRLSMTTLGFLFVLSLAFAGGHPRATLAVVLAVGAAKAVEAVTDVYFGYLQQRERMDVSAKALILKGVLSFGAMSAGVALTGDVFWGAAALAGVWVLLLLSYIPWRTMQIAALDPCQAGIRPLWQPHRLVQLAWLAVPLGLSSGLISLRATIPRYLLSQFWGEGLLGIYAAQASLFVAGNTVVAALATAGSPRLAQHVAVDRNDLVWTTWRKLATVGLVIGGLGIAVSIAFGVEILTILFGSEYASGCVLLTLLMISATFSFVATFTERALVALRMLRPMMFVHAIATASTMVLALWLVRSHGLVGAGITMVASGAIKCVSLVLILASRVGVLRRLLGGSL